MISCKWIFNPKFLNLSTIILTSLPFIMNYFKKREFDVPFINFINDHNIEISGIFAILVIILHISDLIFLRSKKKKQWLYKLLQHIAVEHLAGCSYPNRITILRKQKGYILFIKSFWYFIFVNFINNFKNRCWLDSFHKIAIHVFSDYLTIYVRYSNPEQKMGCTYFKLSDDSKRKIYNGVADKCFQEGLEVSVQTCYINEIQIKNDLKDYKNADLKRIKKYMKDCFIDESFYDTLKNIRIISNNLYAVPIALGNQHIWGVVIIDNSQKEARDFKNELDAYLSSYMKIINFSLSAIK